MWDEEAALLQCSAGAHAPLRTFRSLGYISEIDEQSGQGKSPSDEILEKTKGETRNIVQSARCKTLFDSTCLAKGSESDATYLGDGAV